MGPTAYADDLALLAPDRVTLQKMVTLCEEYGQDHNLVFSTDPDPNKARQSVCTFAAERERLFIPH